MLANSLPPHPVPPPTVEPTAALVQDTRATRQPLPRLQHDSRPARPAPQRQPPPNRRHPPGKQQRTPRLAPRHPARPRHPLLRTHRRTRRFLPHLIAINARTARQRTSEPRSRSAQAENTTRTATRTIRRRATGPRRRAGMPLPRALTPTPVLLPVPVTMNPAWILHRATRTTTPPRLSDRPRYHITPRPRQLSHQTCPSSHREQLSCNGSWHNSHGQP